MLSDDPDIFTFSVHCQNNFPFIKQKSDLDIPLDAGTEDTEYLKTINSTLPDLLNFFDPDIVIYDAGVDPHKNDPLGKLALSTEGIFKRDFFVISECTKRRIPIACVVGGGYSDDLNELAYRHSLVHRAASKVFEKL